MFDDDLLGVLRGGGSLPVEAQVLDVHLLVQLLGGGALLLAVDERGLPVAVGGHQADLFESESPAVSDAPVLLKSHMHVDYLHLQVVDDLLAWLLEIWVPSLDIMPSYFFYYLTFCK